MLKQKLKPHQLFELTLLKKANYFTVYDCKTPHIKARPLHNLQEVREIIKNMKPGVDRLLLYGIEQRDGYFVGNVLITKELLDLYDNSGE